MGVTLAGAPKPAPRPAKQPAPERRRRGAPPAVAPLAQGLPIGHVALEREEGQLADCLRRGSHTPPTALFAPNYGVPLCGIDP